MQNTITLHQPDWEKYSGQPLSAVDTNHIFKIKISDYVQKISDYPSLLSEQEIARSKRFLKEEDKDNYLVRKYALRLILGKFLQQDPTNIQFQKTENKKPGIANIHFNTSHTKGYAVITISQEPVGIDIEYLNLDFDFSDLLSSCFSTEESRFISSTPDVQQNFYILWTRKEALIKATGEGLVNNLSQIPCLTPYAERKEATYEVKSFQDGDLHISTANLLNLKKLKLWAYSPTFFSF